MPIVYSKNTIITFESVFLAKLETVKESRKIWNFHFDLQLVPTVLNGTLHIAKELV